ncbi:MAG: carbohydrate kinase family protein [Trichloromonas sp.]|jgi:hypothetical protein|nr:carbohydrate kinase family protein [Trichloromonas sp.]
MKIAGGFYREQCCMPAWDAMLGSGARAAMAVSTLSPGSSLHTYAGDCDRNAVGALKEQGIKLQIRQRPTGVVFSYFHPLSRPHIYPSPHEIVRQPAITVNGDAVLRFGFLEGEAIVEADRAVYDPQTWRNPVPFGANGSRVNVLAIVLNELELRSSTGLYDLKQAALQIIEKKNADVVVVKRGIWGATVYERSGLVMSIPAYRSSRIFKIGTGDVFSAIFAHFWAEKKLPPAEAADLASRAVAQYCSTGNLPIEPGGLDLFVPIHCGTSGTVLLWGETGSLGQRYTMEEARFVLKDLGVNVCCPVLDGCSSNTVSAVLILADGADEKTIKSIESELLSDLPIVVLQEKGMRCDELLKAPALAKASIIDDFTTATYAAAWAAVERRN